MYARTRRSERGFTLAELLLLMVILAIGLAGILLLFNTVVVGSVEPAGRKQAMAVAESMLEEILLQPFAAGGWTGAATQGNRASFDDARDYNTFSTTGILTIDGTPIPELAAYNVRVDIAGTALGASPAVPAADSLRVTVTVTGPRPQARYVLEGYKLAY